MRVVLSGYYGFDNVGDEAILYSIVQALREKKPDIEITVLSNHPAHTKQTYQVDAVNRWKMKDVMQAIKESDGLISGGGSLLQDQTGLKSIPYYCGIMKIAQHYKKQVFVYAQGMGPINKAISKWLVKATLNKVQYITVRDTSSKKLLKDIGVSKEVQVVPDPVMGINLASFHNSWLESQDLKESFITVSVRDWPSTIHFKEEIAKSLDQLVQNGHDIVFIPMHGEHDDKTSNEVAALMTERSLIAPFQSTIEEKISIIGKSKLLIGMRLHSLIFSAINLVPFVALSYDPKIDAFAHICDQPIAGHVEESNWNSQSLTQHIETILNQYSDVKEQLELRVKPLQASALQTAENSIQAFS